MSLFICAPILAYMIVYLHPINSASILSIYSMFIIFLTYLVYSSYMVLFVSITITVVEGVSIGRVIRGNYYYYQIASAFSIPITIVMTHLWYQEGIIGVILLALPLLLVSYGINLAFERGKLEERNRRDSQLAELGKTAASIIHEIKKPISRIMMSAEYCIESPEDMDVEAELRKCLGWAREVGDISKSLLSNLSGQLSLEKVNVREVVTRVVELMSEKYRDRIRLSFTEEKELYAYWDAQSIALVLGNIISNALEIADDSTVEVHVEPHRSRRWFKSDQGTVILRVADTGPGLPAVDTELLFDPLYSTRESGSGVGLFIAKQITLAHGGSLSAQPRSAGGAEFVLQLPLSG